jgi:hypothetical protein
MVAGSPLPKQREDLTELGVAEYRRALRERHGAA